MKPVTNLQCSLHFVFFFFSLSFFFFFFFLMQVTFILLNLHIVPKAQNIVNLICHVIKQNGLELTNFDFEIQQTKRKYFLCQGCESSSFQLISLFLKIFLCQNFSLFYYFQPIFGIFAQFHTVFSSFLYVVSHTSALFSVVLQTFNCLYL